MTTLDKRQIEIGHNFNLGMLNSRVGLKANQSEFRSSCEGKFFSASHRDGFECPQKPCHGFVEQIGKDITGFAQPFRYYVGQYFQKKNSFIDIDKHTAGNHLPRDRCAIDLSEYYEWMLSKESPWRSILDEAGVEITRGDPWPEIKDVPVGVVFTNTNVNTHQLTNFLIATRKMSNYTYYWRVLREGKKHGLSFPVMLYLLSYYNLAAFENSVRPNSKGSGLAGSMWFFETRFGNFSQGYCDLRRFVSGDMSVLTNQTFNELGGRIKCNPIWNHTDKKRLPFFKIFDDVIKEKGIKRKGESRFSDNVETWYELPRDDFFGLAKVHIKEYL